MTELMRRGFQYVAPLWFVIGFVALGYCVVLWPLVRLVHAGNGWALYAVALVVGVGSAVVATIEFRVDLVASDERSQTLRYSLRSAGLVPFTKGRVALVVGALAVAPFVVGGVFRHWSAAVDAAVALAVTTAVYASVRLIGDRDGSRRSAG